MLYIITNDVRAADDYILRHDLRTGVRLLSTKKDADKVQDISNKDMLVLLTGYTKTWLRRL